MIGYVVIWLSSAFTKGTTVHSPNSSPSLGPSMRRQSTFPEIEGGGLSLGTYCSYFEGAPERIPIPNSAEGLL